MSSGAVNDDRTLRTDTVRRTGDVGLDVKWGVRADLTLDLTVNTDFAQVEADEQQVNLTRFPLFFPEKRPFFLENAQLFQLGQPQSIDLFFSRRIGLSASGEPIDIVAGGRLSGKLGGYNVGLLNMQTDAAVDERPGRRSRPPTTSPSCGIQREVGRSNFGAMFVGRQGVGEPRAGRRLQPGLRPRSRLAGDDERARVRVSGADRFARSKGGSDYAGRAAYTYANPLWSARRRLHAGRRTVQSRGRVPATARLPLARGPLQPQLSAEAVAVDPPHSAARQLHRLHRSPERARKLAGPLALLRHPDAIGRPLRVLSSTPDRIGRDGRSPSIRTSRGGASSFPPGEYAWTRGVFEGHTNLSAPISASLLHRVGSYYDGDYHGWQLTVGLRAGARLLSEIGWNRDDITLPGGRFRNDLVPVKVSYAFTSLASLQGLIQYNQQASTFSSNIRLALLNRSGTGFFLVYNDRRDTSSFTPDELLGRSFVVKYTRLFDY